MKTIIKPYNKESSKKEEVECMFNNISNKYDLLNKLLSLNIDRCWRQQLEKRLKKSNPENILDAATGTADLAIGHAKSTKANIIGIDLAENMLDIGRKKIKTKGLEQRIKLIRADAENLPFKDNTFDAVTCAFGVRNFQNLDKGLSEFYRVLKHGSKFYILEFSKPKGWFAPIFIFYFKNILPVIGRWISKDSSAYTYLPQSVENFPCGKDMIKILAKNKFKNLKYTTYTFGVATLYEGVK